MDHALYGLYVLLCIAGSSIIVLSLTFVMQVFSNVVGEDEHNLRPVQRALAHSIRTTQSLYVHHPHIAKKLNPYIKSAIKRLLDVPAPKSPDLLWELDKALWEGVEVKYYETPCSRNLGLVLASWKAEVDGHKIVVYLYGEKSRGVPDSVGYEYSNSSESKHVKGELTFFLDEDYSDFADRLFRAIYHHLSQA